MKRMILFFFAVTCASQLQAGEVSGMRLGLEIKPEKDAFKAGEEIHFLYTIRNEGDTPVYLLSILECYSLYFRDCASGERIVDINPYPWDHGLSAPDKDSFILLKPGEFYEYKNPDPILIKKGTYGLYLLEFRTHTYPVSKSGFIVEGNFYGSDYPMKKLKGLDEFKDIDHSVPLFRGNQIVSDVAIIFDGECFRVKGEDACQVKDDEKAGTAEKKPPVEKEQRANQ